MRYLELPATWVPPAYTASTKSAAGQDSFARITNLAMTIFLLMGFSVCAGLLLLDDIRIHHLSGQLFISLLIVCGLSQLILLCWQKFKPRVLASSICEESVLQRQQSQLRPQPGLAPGFSAETPPGYEQVFHP